MNVEWKEINPDYIVSSDGQVMSRKKGGLKALSPGKTGKGYCIVSIYANGKKTSRHVHRIVAAAFLGDKPTPAHQINHKDGDKTNNRVNNLEWVTGSENMVHAYRVIGIVPARGESIHQSKKTEEDIRSIRLRYKSGETQKQIAKDYGTRQSDISRIVLRQRWAWLD